MLAEYEVYALRYAEHARSAAANFLDGDPEDGPMPLSYYVWLVRDAGRCWLVDTGFGADAARARGRVLQRSPAEALALLGVAAEAIDDVVLTHLHYDHAGNCAQFPNARFHLQEQEMQFATGRYMAHRCLRDGYNVFDVLRLVELAHAGRVHFHAGDSELAPGLSLHLVGGHTMGMQAVRVHTRRGWLVLASDAAHFYRNLQEERPYPVVFNVGEMAQGWRRLLALAASPAHVIPGHDPAVLARYPADAPGDAAAWQGIVAPLHREPVGA